MNKKKSLSTILAESYSVYFEFIGTVISCLIISFFFLENLFFRILLIIVGVFYASFRAYSHVKNNN
ncbi:MAG: hypothetical protein CL518_00820 [Actinobacteria bacterium]|nr:hypothetical protein [Actinomycetota bacterium]